MTHDPCTNLGDITPLNRLLRNQHVITLTKRGAPVVPRKRCRVAGTVDEAVAPGSAATATPSLQLLTSLDLHPQEVYGCEFIAGRQDRLLTASSDSVFLWDIETRKILHFAQGGKVPQAEAVPARWKPVRASLT